MSLNPGYVEQQILAHAQARQTARRSARERRAEILAGGLYALVAAALLLVLPPDLHAVSAIAAGSCLAALVLALGTDFATGAGFTVPSQLAFVPLLFALPLAAVPVAVTAAWTLATLPLVLRGELRPARLSAGLANSWFANAMTTDRAYRAALGPEVAAQELRDCAGSQFDPSVVHAVLAVV